MEEEIERERNAGLENREKEKERVRRFFSWGLEIGCVGNKLE